MRHERFESSLISELSYDEDTHLLKVTFRSGRTYEYFMVPTSAFEALNVAGSKGEYFNREIRPRYPCREVKSDTRTLA